jgi:hypothetical protein
VSRCLLEMGVIVVGVVVDVLVVMLNSLMSVFVEV